MNHALVVGGTGMLSGVSLWLVENGYHVSIIARNPERMEKLIGNCSTKNLVTPLFINYTNDKELQEKVNITIQQNGSIDLVVAWIHSIAEDALKIIAKEVSKHRDEWNLFHVLGSSSNIERIKREVSVPDNCNYHRVQLGFVLEGTYSRWLSNREISEGVIEAVQTGKPLHTVGVLEPWDSRP